MKKSLASILAAALVLSAMTGCSNGTENSDESSLSIPDESSFVDFSKDADLSASSDSSWIDFEYGTTLLKYYGTDEKVVIPAEIKGKRL